MFKAAVLDWHNLDLKLSPNIFASSAIIEGDGGVGSVRQLSFTSVMPFSDVKEKLDFVDHGKFECKSTVLQGGHVGTILNSASSHFNIEPISTSGCVCKLTTESKVHPGADARGEEAKAKEPAMKLFKTAKSCLLTNPNAYVLMLSEGK